MDVSSPTLSLFQDSLNNVPVVIELSSSRNNFNGQAAVVDGSLVTVPPKITSPLDWIGSTIDLASQGLDIYNKIMKIAKPTTLTTVKPQTIAVSTLSNPTPNTGIAAPAVAGTNTLVIPSLSQPLSLQMILILSGVALLVLFLASRR